MACVSPSLQFDVECGLRVLQAFSGTANDSNKEVTTVEWLESSLNELEECSASALDEGLEEPSELGLRKTRELLKTISTRVTDQPDIYLMA